jgi:hypothetical protein
MSNSNTPELELAGKAAFAADGCDPAGWRDTDVYPSWYFERYVGIARASLMAIREPTERMIGAMGRLSHPRDSELFTAAIDAALGEGKG